MTEKWIVTNGKGLNVRSQMDSTQPKNIVRQMSKGEGFTVYETYQVKGSTGLQKWGRVSDNPGDRRQEYTCLSIGNNMIFAVQETSSESETMLERIEKLEAWARTMGYPG
jgi:hypothetical protein